MKVADLHPYEDQRLKSLHALNILQQIPDKKFDDIVSIASFVCDTPIALISIVDETRQCFKAKLGLSVSETPRDVAFCAHAILDSAPLIIADALQDDRFADNPLVNHDPMIRFYAGVPFLSPDGYPIGTICVIDTHPRTLSSEQIAILESLARQLTKILELMTKVTELEQTQRVIKTQEQEARALIDGVPSLIGHWGLDLRLINANAVYQTFFGDISRTKGLHAKEILGEELYQKNLPHILSALQGEQVQFEREITKVDGSRAFALVSFVPNMVAGKVMSFFSISTDVTYVKQAEILRRELESRLIKSDRLSALGEIACGIAHEINTPLAIMNVKLLLLKEKILEGSATKQELIADIEKVESTTLRISKIVKGLQTYSRNSDQDPLQQSALHSIISDSLILCQDRIKNEEVQLSVHCDPNLKIECHPAQISQVLINLLINGIDALKGKEEKWIKIEVSAEGKVLVLRISDSGPGIPHALAQKIMEPFFTTKEVGKGTGLGLSISKNIIETHHGKFFLDQTAPNTTFVITLPLAV